MPFDLRVQMFFARLFAKKGEKPVALLINAKFYEYYTPPDLMNSTRAPSAAVYEALKQFDGKMWIDGEGWNYYAILPNQSLADQFEMTVALM